MDKIDLERLRADGIDPVQRLVWLAQSVAHEGESDSNSKASLDRYHRQSDQLRELREAIQQERATLLDQIASLKERVGELEEALLPFARYANCCSLDDPDDVIECPVDHVFLSTLPVDEERSWPGVTLGDLRRAAALAQAEKEG